MSKITDLVSAESILQWIIILFIVAFFLYKELPEFYRRVTSRAKKEQKEEFNDEGIRRRLDNIEKRLDRIDDKLASDYEIIQELKLNDAKQRRLSRESLEEREIIMRALLGIIGGLQEIGADGPTQDAQTEITTYLAKQAHRDEEQ